MKRNVSGQSTGAQLVSATDGTAFTGTATVVITEDNGTQTASGGTAPAHEGNGYHSYSPTQGETDAEHIAFTWTGTGAIPVTIQMYTTFPQTVDNDTANQAIKTKTDFLPSATAGAAGGVFIAGTNAATTVTTSFTTTFTGNLTGSVGSVTGAVGSVTAGVTVSTNSDKTGYSISGTKTTLDALNDIAATAIVSSGAITTLAGAVTTVTTSLNLTTNNDKTGYVLTQSFPTNFAATVITAGGAVDGIVQGFVNGTLTESAADRINDNFEFFYDNANAQTTQVVDDVGGGGGSGLTAQQTRDAMKLAPTGGSPDVGSIDEHLDDILTDVGTDIPARFDGIEGATFATGTDSLEAIRNRGDAEWITGNTVAPDNAGIAAIQAVTDVIPDSGAMTSIAQGAAITALNNISVADIFAGGDIDGFTFEESQKIQLGALGGKLSGAGTATEIIRAADDSKARITAIVDAAGNRTAITLDGTG